MLNSMLCPSHPYRKLYGTALRAADNEWIMYKTGVRADFELQISNEYDKQQEAEALFAQYGPLSELSKIFDGILDVNELIHTF